MLNAEHIIVVIVPSTRLAAVLVPQETAFPEKLLTYVVYFDADPNGDNEYSAVLILVTPFLLFSTENVFCVSS